MKSHVTAVYRPAIFHLRKFLRIRRYLTAAPTCICHKQTRCWQYTAPSTASETNTTASESTELGSPLDRRCYENLPCYTAADEVALAADSSASEFKIVLLTHLALTGHAPRYIEHCVSRRQPVSSCASANTVYCVYHAQGVTGVTERVSPKSVECVTDINSYHCCF